MLKTPKNTLSVGGKTFNIVLTLSVIDELQSKYERLDTAIQNVADFNVMIKELAEIATVFINDDIECHNEDNPNDKWDKITPEWLKRRIALNSTSLDENKVLAVDLAKTIMRAFNLSMPESEEEIDPNSQTTA